MVQLQRLAIAPSQLLPPHLSLTPEQHHYLCRVLRLGAGDRFIAMDGQGHWWLAELGADASQAQVLEQLPIQHELPITVVLLVAMPKGNGMDDIVRQATELGVAAIVPILSDRTLLQPSPQKLDRWRRIAQEAAEQSERQLMQSALADCPELEEEHLDLAKREATALVRAEPGVQYPLHRHTTNEEIYLLEGDLVVDSATYKAGDYLRSKSTSNHSPSTTGGCMFLVRTSIDNEYFDDIVLQN